jgi:hypothetical protein
VWSIEFALANFNDMPLLCIAAATWAEETRVGSHLRSRMVM